MQKTGEYKCSFATAKSMQPGTVLHCHCEEGHIVSRRGNPHLFAAYLGKTDCHTSLQAGSQ